jgi:hypothetical protein
VGEWVFGWEEFGKMKEGIKQLIKEGIKTNQFPMFLYKYRDFGEFTNDIIMHSQFYFSPPKSFNDPFDCNLFFKESYSKEEIDKYKNDFLIRNPSINPKILDNHFNDNGDTFHCKLKESRSQLIENTGILALSKNYKSITMWSHYSKNHEGLVFELDVKKDYSFFYMFGIVDYIEEYELLSYAEDPRKELYNLFTTKYIDWKYEEEIRIIDFDKYGVRKFKKNLLKSILFGYKAKEENIKSVINLCQTNGFTHIKFKKAKLIPGKFALDFDEINKNDYLES